jgi:hypothetical protein
MPMPNAFDRAGTFDLRLRHTALRWTDCQLLERRCVIGHIPVDQMKLTCRRCCRCCGDGGYRLADNETNRLNWSILRARRNAAHRLSEGAEWSQRLSGPPLSTFVTRQVGKASHRPVRRTVLRLSASHLQPLGRVQGSLPRERGQSPRRTHRRARRWRVSPCVGDPWVVEFAQRDLGGRRRSSRTSRPVRTGPAVVFDLGLPWYLILTSQSKFG